MSSTKKTVQKATPKETTEKKAPEKKATAKKDDAKQEGDKFVIRHLIRDAAEGKVTQEKFTETLITHYKSKGRDDAWIGKRVKRLWRRTGK